jgi:hypothetical protein
MKRPGPSFVIETSNARRGPADNAFSHFGQIRMKCLGPSFVAGTSNARRGPVDNTFSHFGRIRMKRLGPSFVVGTSNARRGPVDNTFFHSSSLRHYIYKQVLSSLPLCWQVANTSGHTAHEVIMSVAMVIQSSHSEWSFKYQKKSSQILVLSTPDRQCWKKVLCVLQKKPAIGDANLKSQY